MLKSAVTSLLLAVTALSQEIISDAGLGYNSSLPLQTILRVDTGRYGPEIEEVHYCKLRSCSLVSV